MAASSKFAFTVAGTHSGCGKTTVALALMAACRARGLAVQPFKVGPDFIDPGFHTVATGRPSHNLDGWMLSESYNRGLFARLLASADGAVVEGVMGLFDGYDGVSEAGSTAQMAKWLGTPIVLVVDARSMARSAAALVHGFSRFDPGVRLAGVIFNRVGSPGHLNTLRDAMATALPDIPVIGGIPREERITLPERHLGLVIAEEVGLDHDWLESVRRLAERHLDVGRLLTAASRRAATERTAASSEVKPPGTHPCVPLAVARDRAFCFYYEDNLEWLEHAGAELHFFSPVAGDGLPEGAAGLYLGGGYPEIHGRALAANTRWQEDVRRGARAGLPIYAECGGLMALSRWIETRAGDRHTMAGVLPFATRMGGRRKALGYTEVLLREACLLGEPGLRLRGHEFHYSEIVESVPTAPWTSAYELQGRSGRPAVMEGYRLGSILASYVHLHFGSAPEAAANFVGACRSFRALQAHQGRPVDGARH
jgi:cobyrinic acid a,c-diamide synthase